MIWVRIRPPLSSPVFPPFVPPLFLCLLDPKPPLLAPLFLSLARTGPSLFSLVAVLTPPLIWLSFMEKARERDPARFWFWFRVLSLVRRPARTMLRSPALGDFRALGACSLTGSLAVPCCCLLFGYKNVSISLSRFFFWLG